MSNKETFFPGRTVDKPLLDDSSDTKPAVVSNAVVSHDDEFVLSQPSFSVRLDSLVTKTAFEKVCLLVEVMLAYAQLQTTSEKRCIQDLNELRKTARHLRSIFDSVNPSEKRSIETLNELSQTLKELDMQYYKLKDKAKSLLTACGEERDMYKKKYALMMDRVQDVEIDLFSAKALYSQQETELKDLEQCSQMSEAGNFKVSELCDSVLQLEKQNKIIEDDIRNLKVKISEAQGTLASTMKESARGAKPPDNDDEVSYTKKLENTIKSLEERSLQKKKEYEESILIEQNNVIKAKQRAASLLELCENLPTTSASLKV